MNYRKILLLGGFCLLLTGCLMQAPQITYRDNEFRLNGLDSVNAKFNFDLHNPNLLPLNGRIDYTFYVADQEFLTGQSAAINAPANGATVFALQQDLAFAQIFGSASELVNAIARGQKTLKVRVSGEYRAAVLGFIELPLKFAQEAEVPLPDMRAVEQELTRQLQEQARQNLNELNMQDLQNLFK
ncbi:MAG: LEA type 2 family protein [Candidatus Margulisbacteria bacterium]|jgi:hypothetical protein|nr:LEA type 2 family protein [Candidatus Margulisiibacteriota bacterium]